MPIPCQFCKRPVDPKKAGSAQFVWGWAPKRSGGGANQVHVTSKRDAFAHWVCVKDGFDPNQLSLLEDP